jgi:hypothetical protein
MASDGVIFILSFMRTSIGIQYILRLYIKEFEGFSVDINDGKDL